MKVRATKTGFYGDKLRFEGDEFTIDSKTKLGSWMEQIKKKPGPKPRALVSKPELEEDEDITTE